MGLLFMGLLFYGTTFNELLFSSTLFHHFQPYNKNINNLFTYKKILLKLDNKNLKAYKRNIKVAAIKL